MKKRLIGLLIIVVVLALSAKVIYQFEPEKTYLLKPKTMKSKSAEFLHTHKENYMRYLDEKTDLDYVLDWKSGVDKNGDTLKYFSSKLYDCRINIKKLKELQKLGLSNYTDYESKLVGNRANPKKISMYTLAYQIIASDIIFIGTVQKIEDVSYPDFFIETRVTVKVNQFLKGAYYYDTMPENFIIYSEYDQKSMTEDYRKTYEKRGKDKILDLGEKYLFFLDKHLDSRAILKDMNTAENKKRMFLIKGSKIEDRYWDNKIKYDELYKRDDYKKLTDINKLKEYIKQLEDTNETENFFDIDFK